MTDADCDEFDCLDCGCHVFSFPAGRGAVRCATCVALPGWFRDPALRRRFEPDCDWQPPADEPATRAPPGRCGEVIEALPEKHDE